MRLKSVPILLAGLVILFGFNNCSDFSPDRLQQLTAASAELGNNGSGTTGSNAGTTGSSDSSGSTNGSSGTTLSSAQQLELGQKLYATDCQSCHGALASTDISKASVSLIRSKMSSVSAMKFLVLSDLDVNEVSQALGGASAIVSATPAPTATPGSTTPPVATSCGASDASVSNEITHRLNDRELSYTLRDLFGFTTAVDITGLPDNGGGLYDNDAGGLYVSGDYVKAYLVLLDKTITNALATTSSLTRSKVMTCADQTSTCAQTIAAAFVPKAFRRPATSAEITALVGVYSKARAASLSHEDSVRVMLKATLVSPNFLFRQVIVSKPNDPSVAQPISQYELASRLSYFIWSSMPDQKLLDLAKAGTLSGDGVLTAQVKRMMKDSKAAPLVDSFARQWLQLDSFDAHDVNSSLFPAFTSNIRTYMSTESRLLLQDIFRNDLSVHALLTANYTYANSSLAKYYGLTPATTSDATFAKTSLNSGSSQRIGILGHGSILTTTSHTNNTSVVYRGKWVLQSLLCDLPPPPPDGISLVVATSDQDASSERLSNPSCASCHSQMDPIGDGLQRFDAIGHYRDTDEAGKGLNTSGKLPGGIAFNGAIELAGILQRDQRFPACAVHHFMSYAIGHEMTAAEKCRVSKIGLDNISVDKPVSQLIVGIVLSDFFRKQAGQEQ